MEDPRMRTRFVLVLGLAAITLDMAPARAADCSQGSPEEQIACLNKTVADLATKLDALGKDAIKWNDRVSLINEDMRIYPRCLDNPGPSSNNITDVYANSCAKIPGQSWMLSKPYRMGR